MKPSELIKSLSNNGCIDTAKMYESEDPNAVDICNAYKGGVPAEVLDQIKSFKIWDLSEVENDLSLLKKIEHPGMIIGGYEISPVLADTISSYYGRDILLSIGRPVSQKGYYTEEELTSPIYLKEAIKRNYTPFTRIQSIVRSNKNSERSLIAAQKAFTLYKGEVSLSYLNDIDPPCGTVFFMRDNLISMDAFDIIVRMSGREVKEHKQIRLRNIPEINTEYKKYRTVNGPIPSNYVKESGRAISNLFTIYKGKDLEPTEWETVNTTTGYPMYIAKNGEETVATIMGRTNEEILDDINDKIAKSNELYGNDLEPVLLSTMGDFFLPIIFSVHC